jgi:hypothetical protein
MNSDLKILLEEIRKEFVDQKKLIDKRFADHDAKWELRITQEEMKRDERVKSLERAAVAFEEWKPTIESSVEGVNTEVQKLSKHRERAVKDKAAADPGLFSQPNSPGVLMPQGTTPPQQSVPPRHLLVVTPTALMGTASIHGTGILSMGPSSILRSRTRVRRVSLTPVLMHLNRLILVNIVVVGRLVDCLN